VIEGQEFFRLHTELQSNGDIYEIDTSVKGIVIGPNSDIQNARIHYPDAQSPGGIGSALVSVADPFVTRMNSFPSEGYPVANIAAGVNPQNVPKKIVVSSDDILPHPNQAFVVDATNPDTADIVVWFPPFLDLLCYHRDPPATPTTRAERQWQVTPEITDRGATTGVGWYFFPHYRRKYFHVRMRNRDTTATFTWKVYGVTFFAYNGVAANYEYPSTNMLELASGTLGAAAGVGLYAMDNVVLYADRVPDIATPATHPIGYFDYMCVSIAGDELSVAQNPVVGFEVIASDYA
jgi:hypothetical protein